MKKYLVVALVVLVAGVLSASSFMWPAPPQKLSGILQYGGISTCQIPDYVTLPVKMNIYLVGNGFPTAGQFQNCWIHASGYYTRIENCSVFRVASSSIQCGPTLTRDPATIATNTYYVSK